MQVGVNASRMSINKYKLAMLLILGGGIILGLLNYSSIKTLYENFMTETSGIQYREYDEYVWPDSLSTKEDVITQYFIPSKSGLSEIHVRLAYNHAALLKDYGAAIQVVLRNEKGNILMTWEASEDTIENWHYFVLETGNLKKGEVYSISLSQVSGAAENGRYLLSWVPFIYDDTYMEDIPMENLQCEYNGIQQNYNWDLYYVYHCLNNDDVMHLIIINIIVIVILILSISLLFCHRQYRRKVFLLLSLFFTVIIIYGGIKAYTEYSAWYNKNIYIAHAMGGIDGIAYTNSRESFENSYNNGIRVFEADFSLTSDNQIVLMHDWENLLGRSEQETGYVPTLEEYKKTKLYGKYTTLDIYDLFQLMLEYPDIYIVTDSKSADYDDVKEQFIMISAVLDHYSTKDRIHILSHCIVQLYNDEMLDAIESVIHFDNYIYTLYQRGYDNLDLLADFCVRNNIPVVTMPYTSWTIEQSDYLHKRGLKVFLHTLNDTEQVQECLDAGIDGIYTDFITSLD